MKVHPVVHRRAHRLRRHAREMWDSKGGGFYGFVATVTFFGLETVNLVGDVAALPHVQLGIGGVVGWFVGNLVQGLMTALWSTIWPVAWISRLGVGVKLVALLAGAYVVYRLIRPLVSRLLREPEGTEPVEPDQAPTE
ncbi:MAG TPA: hypothetical protein VJ957_10815 [Longimicrobiales bacterium]|nr:hypothetical protein [Longimicrobiales bacterium]